MRRRRPGRADLIVLSALVVAATLSLIHAALSQDAKIDLDAYMKRNEAERAQYLQEHPVRPSTLFDLGFVADGDARRIRRDRARRM